jgi:ABC-type glycerol-3-phosphate transport system substrate-binding protein
MLLGALILMLGAGAGVAQDVPAEFQCHVDWQRFAGTQIDVLLDVHPWQAAVEPQIPQFESLTGIKVRIKKLPPEQYFVKVPADLQAGTFGFDVYMTQYYDAPKYAAERWTEPLGRYLLDPDLTDLAWYDWLDFFPAAQKQATIGDTYEDRISITAETQVLVYRTDVLADMGADVPTTFHQMLATAGDITTGTDLYGITLRGGKTLWWPLHGVLKSFGGDYFNAEMEPVIDSPESEAGAQVYLDLLEYAPPGSSSFEFPEIAAAMMSGQACMFLDSSAVWQKVRDQKRSAVADKVSMAPFPEGPAGRGGHAHYWGLSMSPDSQKKEAAWYFMQWATSKPVFLNNAVEGVGSPRLSTWDEPAFKETQPEAFVYAMQESLKTAILSRAHAQYMELMDRVRSVMQQVMEGRKDLDDGLSEIAASWEEMLSS